MAPLTVISAYPGVDEIGLPLLTNVVVEFSEAIDVDSISDGTFVVASMAKNVIKTGPTLHNWSDLGPMEMLTGDLLKSPSFDGIVEGEYSFSADLKTVNYKPGHTLNPNVNHVVILSKGILTRTIGPISTGGYSPQQGNGYIELHGPYDGTVEDGIVIQIVETGGLDSGKFIYWFNSDPFHVSLPTTIDRVIALEKNLRVKFAAGTYVIGDTFTADLHPGRTLDAIYSWKFATGDGSLVEPPVDVKSVSLLGATLTGNGLPVEPGIVSISYLGALPDDDGGDVPIEARRFTIEFSAAMDPTTVNDTTVTVMLIGLSSYNDRPGAPVELTKTLILSGRTLDIVLANNAPISVNQEIVFLLSGLKDTLGTSMPRTTYALTTRYDPFYTTAKRVRLEIGPFVTGIPTDTINRLIFNYSYAASMLNYKQVGLDDEWYKFILAEYVVCSVIRDLMDVVTATGSDQKTKTLGDLRVSYRNTGKSITPKDIRDKASKCADTLKPSLQNGGYPYVLPVNTIKGGWDRNRPRFGRDFLRVKPEELPIGNIRQIIFDRYYVTGAEVATSLYDTEKAINQDEDVKW